MEYLQKVRSNLKSIMYTRGLTGKDVAAEIGVTPSSMSRYLQDKRDPELLVVINMAKYFGVSMDWMVGLSEERNTDIPEESRKAASLYSILTEDDRLIVDTVFKKYTDLVS